MNLLLLCLGAFIAGVFVGARLWFALFCCAVVLTVWWFGRIRPPPDRQSTRDISHFGHRPRGGGH